MAIDAADSKGYNSLYVKRKTMITILTLIAIVISGAVVLTMNGRLIYVHASSNPLAGFCSYHPDACTGPVTSRDAALAKVSGMMKRISGGTLPAHIDVTNMTVDQADQLLSGPTGLPSGTPVWYVRIYNPVTLTHSTPVVSSHPSDFNYARGAAWVIEAQTGTVVRFTAFG